MKIYKIIVVSLVFLFSVTDLMYGNITNSNLNNRNNSDTVNIAFKKTTNNNIVGAVTQLQVEKINVQDHTIWASEVFAGRTMGMRGNGNIRGIGGNINVSELTGSGTFSGNALFIVDGLPRDIDGLRLSEVDNITVLKDINSAILYGSSAVNGVVLITTKRGKLNKNVRQVSLNYGMQTPLALPEFLNAADYMTYYNLARENDDLIPQYSEDLIENYRSGNKYRYPDVDYYSSEYVKSFRPYVDLNGEFSGGNQSAKYYLNFGMNSLGGWLNFGEGANAMYNTFNIRGNVDLKVTDWINTSVDATALFGNDKSQRGGYFSDAVTYHPHEYVPLIPIDLIDPDNPLLTGRKTDVDGKYLLGGNINRQTTPFGHGYVGGVYEMIERKFSFNNRINFDLGMLTEGLSFHTNLSFDYYMRYNQTVANQYAVYEPIWVTIGGEDRIIDLTQYGEDIRTGIQSVENTFFRRRLGFYGQLDYNKTFDGIHGFSGTLLGYGSSFKEQADYQGVKHTHLGLRLAYAYDEKYLADFSAALINSVKLAPGNRVGFSPSLGLSWIISEESLLSPVNQIDLLKLRLSGGILNSDVPIDGFFYYDNQYGTSGSYSWNEGVRSRAGVMSYRYANENLGFAKRKEVNAGIEGLFFNNLIGFNANFFYNIYSDLIARPNTQYPSYFIDFRPYENYEKDSYTGVEFELNFNKKVNDWKFMVGLNGLYITSKRLVVDEVYEDAYRYRQGHPRDATFGLEAIGFFKDQQDIDDSPTQAFGAVRPGDIKYKDQNGDNIIDENDEIYIRRSTTPFNAGLQFEVLYKNISLYVLGEGRAGAEAFMEGNYYWVDGNKKYSEVVLNSWTPETAETATFPRLSSLTNSNNHRRSTFWLYNNDYFKIRSVQLTYVIPDNITKALKMDHFDVFINAKDPFQFTKHRKIMETNVGGYPYVRTFSIGLRTKF